MEAVMIDKVQYLMAGLAALSMGALFPLPAFASDNGYSPLPAYAMGSGTVYPPAPRLEPRLAPQPKRLQVADSVQSTNSSASASASSSASSSVTVSGGKQQGKCTAEASAHAKANDVEDSDHDMKVVEGQGCSAKAESSATVKPQKPQSE